MPDFKYDVAFSLLAEDEATVASLNDLLKDRLKTFFYPERQREVTGTDGEDTFARVFQAESRAVVIVYRSKWGSTRWTRIEQTAIRNRGMEETYGFALLIPMDRPVVPPRWFPKQNIWFDLDRLGISGAAAVIEQRVRELGGSHRPETIEDAAERVRREIQFRRERESYLESAKAVADAVTEVRTMFDFVKKQVTKLKDPASNLVFEVTEEYHTLDVMSWGFILRIAWHNEASNMLHNSGLALRILEPSRDYFFDRVPPTRHEERIFDFDISELREPGWTERHGQRQFFTSAFLAEIMFKTFLEYIRKHAATMGN